jgi:hypothetical protein
MPHLQQGARTSREPEIPLEEAGCAMTRPAPLELSDGRIEEIGEMAEQAALTGDARNPFPPDTDEAVVWHSAFRSITLRGHHNE